MTGCGSAPARVVPVVPAACRAGRSVAECRGVPAQAPGARVGVFVGSIARDLGAGFLTRIVVTYDFGGCGSCTHGSCCEPAPRDGGRCESWEVLSCTEMLWWECAVPGRGVRARNVACFIWRGFWERSSGRQRGEVRRLRARVCVFDWKKVGTARVPRACLRELELIQAHCSVSAELWAVDTPFRSCVKAPGFSFRICAVSCNVPASYRMAM